MSMMTAYDLATLKRMLGMGSETSVLRMGRIERARTGRVRAGARICRTLA